MLKKLISLLLLSTIVNASDTFVALKYGLTSLNQDGVDFNNNSYELDLTINQNYMIFPRFGLAYVDIDEKGETVTGLTQLSLEGLYDIQVASTFSPYLFGGVGYENVSHSRDGFDSQFFLDGGVGVRYPLNDYLNVMSELKGLYMLTGNDQDSELAFYIGIGANLGGIDTTPLDSDGDGVYDSSDRCANTPYGTSVDSTGCPVQVAQTAYISDQDGDSIEDSQDRCPNTPQGTPVDIHGCPVACKTTSVIADEKPRVYDSDGDGIEDRLDKCPHTPRGVRVNSNGCKIQKRVYHKIKTLHIRFEPNSATIPFTAKPKIADLADYIKSHSTSHINVVGYTDTSGNPQKNQLLSLQRARSVKRLLVRYGVPSYKITAIGKGELNPIAPNDTPYGRAQNRRIEVTVK